MVKVRFNKIATAKVYAGEAPGLACGNAVETLGHRGKGSE